MVRSQASGTYIKEADRATDLVGLDLGVGRILSQKLNYLLMISVLLIDIIHGNEESIKCPCESV